jgi:hypothetical protein
VPIGVAAEPDWTVAAQPQAAILPESSAIIGPPASAGDGPIGGWLPVDLAALEQGVNALLSRLDINACGETPWAVVRLAVSVTGAWAACEIVRLRREPRPRMAAADVPGWIANGPCLEDGV